MSYHSYHIYGYGVELSNSIDVEKLDVFCKVHKAADSLCKLMDEAKNSADEFGEIFKAEDVLSDYDGRSYACSGIASVLADIIEAEKDVRLTDAIDDCGNVYLVLPPTYPWDFLTESEKKIHCKKDVEELVRPYLKELYGDDASNYLFYYQEIENGG